MAALRSFKIICGPLQLLLLFLLQDLGELAVEIKQIPSSDLQRGGNPVQDEPFQPQIHGPQGRITAGSRASFQCSAYDFPSKDIKVVWMKDGKTIQTNQPEISHIELKGERRYHVTSSVAILLGQGDVKSQLSCQIQHSSAQNSQENFQLGDVLRVPPKMRLQTIPPSPVQLNATVMLTCNAESFYPRDAKVELFAKDAPSRKGMVYSRISNPDGTFSLKSFMEVMATEDRNSSVFLCRVQQDSQPLVNESTTLFITRPLKASEGSQQRSLLPLCLALFLSKAAILLFVCCLSLLKVFGHKRTKPPSGTFQEVQS